MISATVVADSLSPFGGHRLTSLQITFPRYILAEGKTHRIILGMLGQTDVEIMESIGLNDFQDGSKNSASSRAIPWKRLLDSVKNNPFIPMAWQKEHTGMQGFEYYTTETCYDAWYDIDRCFGYAQYKNKPAVEYLNELWLDQRNMAVGSVEQIGELKVTKQMINRLLEPFMWHTVLISATEWENFFQLRCPQYEIYTDPETKVTARSWKDLLKHKYTGDFADASTLYKLQCNKGMADIHMMALAECIWDAINESTPKQLQPGDWHIPYYDKIHTEENAHILGRLLLPDVNKGLDAHESLNNIIVKIATGMAARASYTVIGDEKEVSYETLIGIYDKMKAARPFHASPFEHCAPAMTEEEYYHYNRTYHKELDQPNIKNMVTENGWCRNFRGFIQLRHLIETGIM